MADSTIPEDQQSVLRQIGSRLAIQWRGDLRNASVDHLPRRRHAVGLRHAQSLNAVRHRVRLAEGNATVLGSLGAGKPQRVTLLGREGNLEFRPDDAGLRIEFPATHSEAPAYVLRLEGAPTI